jgi:hypothetical protein
MKGYYLVSLRSLSQISGYPLLAESRSPGCEYERLYERLLWRKLTLEANFPEAIYGPQQPFKRNE